MPGGSYVALSGLRARFEELDRLATDIANVGTAGYKSERATSRSSERPSFEDSLQAAVDVVSEGARTDFRPGIIAPTGRDLDFAIDGDGFFVVDSPSGAHYTRNGHFTRQLDGTLTTTDGLTVMGENGPVVLQGGPVTVADDGTIRSGSSTIGRLRVVRFDDLSALIRESGARFRATPGTNEDVVPNAVVRGGALEQSNVSMVDRLAQLTEVSRGFDALQRGMSILANELDARAISELGKR